MDIDKNPHIVVGFWNVQRLSMSGTSESGAARWGLGQVMLEQWIQGAAPPDVILLAEVTQNGPTWAKEINTKTPWTTHGYHAEFVPAAGNTSSGVSPCSFMVISKGQWKILPVGSGTKRPYIAVQVPCGKKVVVVAGCHIIAAPGPKAIDEILTMLTDLTAESPVALLGDMNNPFAEFPKYELQQATTMGWNKTSPGHDTFWSKNDKYKTLDYVWTHGLTCEAVAAPQHTDWQVIDHAPVAFKIQP